MSRPTLLSLDECLNLKSGFLVTVNMQHMYECLHNDDLKNVLFGRSGIRHLCVDGRGARHLLLRAFGTHSELAVGNEILRRKLQLPLDAPVLVIGSTPEAVRAVGRTYPAVRLEQDSSRFEIRTPDQAAVAATLLVRTHGRAFSMIAIALGVPKQELLAAQLATLIPDVPIYCIGGSFEMIAGHLPRAPATLRKIGLEGLWRLFLQPSSARMCRMLYSYYYYFYFLLHHKKLVALTSPQN